MSKRIAALLTGIVLAGALVGITGCTAETTGEEPSSSATASPGDDGGTTPPHGSEINTLVRDTPPAPTDTTSFSYTSTKSLHGDTTRTIYSGCPDGWNVRLGQPDAWGSNIPEPSYSEWSSDTFLKPTIGVGASVNTQYGTSGLYQNIEEEFTNWSPNTHHATLTFWCDKVPSWAQGTVASTKNDRPSVSVMPSCYYCQWNAYPLNAGSGHYLTESGMSATKTVLNLAGDATGEYVGTMGSASYASGP